MTDANLLQLRVSTPTNCVSVFRVEGVVNQRETYIYTFPNDIRFQDTYEYASILCFYIRHFHHDCVFPTTLPGYTSDVKPQDPLISLRDIPDYSRYSYSSTPSIRFDSALIMHPHSAKIKVCSTTQGKAWAGAHTRPFLPNRRLRWLVQRWRAPQKDAFHTRRS